MSRSARIGGSGLVSLAVVALDIFGEAAECIHQFHLLDRIASGYEEAGRTDEVSEALRTRDRHVETIAGKKKCEVTGHIFAARSSHREKDNRRLLTLELVDRCDPRRLEVPRATGALGHSREQ